MWHFDLWFLRTYVISNKKIYAVFFLKKSEDKALAFSEGLKVATCWNQSDSDKLMEQHSNLHSETSQPHNPPSM